MKLEYLLISIFLLPGLAHASCYDKMKATINQLQEVVQAQDLTKQSLITIRRNAQDWKNLLLRGSNEKDRQIMYQRFNDQKIAYEANLIKLKSQLNSLNIQSEAIKILESQKTELFEKYDNALARFGVGSLEAASSADKLVQGGDVQTFRVLENLDKDLSIRVQKSFDLLREEIEKCAKE